MKRQKLESTSLKPGIYFSTKASVSCGRPRESKCGQFQPMRPSAFAFKKPFQGRMLNGKKIIKHFCKEQTRSVNFLGEFDSMEPKTLFQQKNANYSCARRSLNNADASNTKRDESISEKPFQGRKLLSWNLFCNKNFGHIIGNALHFERGEL